MVGLVGLVGPTGNGGGGSVVTYSELMKFSLYIYLVSDILDFSSSGNGGDNT